MANIKYYPEDLGKGFGSLAIKLPMNANGRQAGDRGIFNMSYTTEDQAVSNFKNLLLTRKGERVMHPTFGIGIQERIFEPNTSAIRTEIEFDIRQQAGYYLPYILIDNIIVQTLQDNTLVNIGADNDHAIQIVITFRVTESGANKRMVIFTSDGIVRAEVE